MYSDIDPTTHVNMNHTVIPVMRAADVLLRFVPQKRSMAVILFLLPRKR